MAARGRKRQKPDGGRKESKNTRTLLSYAKKREILQHYHEHGMPDTLQTFFPEAKVSDRESKRKLVYTWLHNEQEIERECSMPSGSDRKRMRRMGSATVLPVEAELQIVGWMKEQQQHGKEPVRCQMLESKAKEVALSFGISSDVFVASSSWRRSFLNRHKTALNSSLDASVEIAAGEPPLAYSGESLVEVAAADLPAENKLDAMQGLETNGVEEDHGKVEEMALV